MRALSISLLISFVFSGLALASQSQNFGLNAESVSRAGGVTASPGQAYSALYNPAALPTLSQSHFGFSTLSVHARYAPLENVMAPKSGRRGRPPVERDIALPALDQARWTLGFASPFHWGESTHPWGLGLAFSGPYDKVRGFTSYSPDDFYSLRYGTADGQFKGTLSLGTALLEDRLFLGAGVSLYLNGSGVAETNLSDAPSSRMDLNVSLQTAPLVGALWIDGPWTTALTFHHKVDPTFQQEIDARVPIESEGSFRQPLLLKSSLYFEPHSLDLEVERKFEVFEVSLGLSYQFWADYQPPVLITETLDSSGVIHRSEQPGTILRSTLNPRVSSQVQLGKGWTWGVGYQYRPSPVEDLSGLGNGLDSNTHVLGSGVQYLLKSNAVLPFASKWGIFGQYHHLNARSVTKANPDLAGFPNYEFSGHAYVFGLSIEALL